MRTGGNKYVKERTPSNIYFFAWNAHPFPLFNGAWPMDHFFFINAITLILLGAYQIYYLREGDLKDFFFFNLKLFLCRS
jgi:hypothetical protein